jgi:hypothetical protein
MLSVQTSPLTKQASPSMQKKSVGSKGLEDDESLMAGFDGDGSLITDLVACARFEAKNT